MDEKELFEKFMGVNSLAVEGISRTVGLVVANLRRGMVDAGMKEGEADQLIVAAFKTFLHSLATMFAEEQKSSREQERSSDV